MNIIESEEDYKRAEARLEEIAGAAPGSEEAEELKALTKAIVDYLKNTKSSSEISR
jgi:hypothetical protein